MVSKKKTIEEKYKKHSQLEHVLARPGMYLGPIETITDHAWILENQKMVDKSQVWVQGGSLGPPGFSFPEASISTTIGRIKS